VRAYSLGMRQRLGLAAALLRAPRLLVLDEPDASLDAAGRGLLPGLLEGRTVVLATHDRALARRLCGRGLLLRAGRDAGDPWALRLLEA
jgi:ABC-2 type transport system ATP-binding protein